MRCTGLYICLFAEETPINILARMISDSDIDLAIWLSLNNAENHPDSWKIQYDLGNMYKTKGETLLAKNALLKAEALNPDNMDISNLLKEVNNVE